MFDVCYECDGKLVKQTGSVYGYWDDITIEFTGLPKYQCNNCDGFYLDEKVAILTQELTRIFSEFDVIPKVVDISNCYEMLFDHLDELQEIISKVYCAKVGQTLIINNKDLNSIFAGDALALAARNSGKLTLDVKKEIAGLAKEELKCL